jgi:hypothetical protein
MPPAVASQETTPASAPEAGTPDAQGSPDSRATDLGSPLPAASSSAAESATETKTAAETPPADPDMAAAPAPTPAPVSVDGRWIIRLQNLFYPEDDYAVELRLDLRQHRKGVDGEGQISIEGRAMSFRVPKATGTGTLRRGTPPTLKILLPFPRPIGDLELEGTPQGDVMAGTFHSSLFKQQGTWQGVRQPR